MLVSLIAAVAANGVIGIDNDMPWHLPGDLPRFRRITLGKPVIMGRQTLEAIGQPLDGRTNIVLTRNQQFARDGCRVAHSFDDALALAGGVEEVMVIGGGEIYRLAMPVADRMYLTLIARSFSGDTCFPDYDESQWTEVSREPQSAGDLHYDHVVFERKAH
ncbi:MAG: dihydrofolate reductase [Pseudomonadota bacterium]